MLVSVISNENQTKAIFIFKHLKVVENISETKV